MAAVGRPRIVQSVYELVVLRGDRGDVLVRGGRHFTEVGHSGVGISPLKSEVPTVTLQGSLLIGTRRQEPTIRSKTHGPSVTTHRTRCTGTARPLERTTKGADFRRIHRTSAWQEIDSVRARAGITFALGVHERSE
jgi:hypothetical protein